MKGKTKFQEKSCGIIVFKEEQVEKQVLLIKHNSGHWGFPKGHIEKNETEKETAIREVLEETGIQSEIINDFREMITYSPKKDVSKDVIFFAGKALNLNPKPQLSEVQEAKWIEIHEALNLITYEDEKQVLKKAIMNQKYEI